MDLFSRDILVWVSTHIRLATFIPKVWFCLLGRCRDGLVLITREMYSGGVYAEMVWF